MTWILLQISWRIRRWKHFENRSTFVELMNECTVAQYLCRSARELMCSRILSCLLIWTDVSSRWTLLTGRRCLQSGAPAANPPTRILVNRGRRRKSRPHSGQKVGYSVPSSQFLPLTPALRKAAKSSYGILDGLWAYEIGVGLRWVYYSIRVLLTRVSNRVVIYGSSTGKKTFRCHFK